MTMTKTKTLLTALTASALAIGSANAAVITWGLATDVVNANDVSTTGTTVEAFNLGYTGTNSPVLTSPTVNGVTFAALVAPDPLDFPVNNSPYAQLGGNTTGNTSYDALLNSVALGGGGGLVEMTLGGGNLVIGNIYQLQIWFVEERSGFDSRVMQYGDGNSNFVNLGNTAGQFGQYAIGTFTADAANQTLTMDAQGFGNAHLNAYQIREIPEPSSLALLGLGGLLIARRRRA